MKQAINVSWLSNMAFEADVNGHKITLDAKTESGGNNLGPQPKPLLLVALAGCTGMDVVSILNKMRVEFDSLNIRVEGDAAEEHPMRYLKMHIIYELKGNDLESKLDKIEKAVNMSQDKYCSVSATFKNSVEISHEIVIL